MEGLVKASDQTSGDRLFRVLFAKAMDAADHRLFAERLRIPLTRLDTGAWPVNPRSRHPGPGTVVPALGKKREGRDNHFSVVLQCHTPMRDSMLARFRT